jgi:nicotinate phosphoribosyltransferase
MQTQDQNKTTKQWPHYQEVLAQNSALWADQYALTMSQALYDDGKHDLNTTFHAFIRKTPFNGSYLLTAGQNIVFEWLKNHWTFDETDIAILRDEKIIDPKTGEAKPLYTPDFIDMLANSKLELTVDAMPEGEIAFADEPIMRVNGPVWQCLMVEAAILNSINSQSLFATLASRIVHAADGEDVFELGLRRAQSLGGLEATRASFVGGVTATSNMLAKKHYGITSSGTMAHALVMLYESELDAFKAYAQHMPHNGIFLVDTYNTLEGIRHAAQTCKDNNIILKGIRLDSGDLAALSIAGKEILTEYGFDKARIAASNDLDEQTILDLKQQGAKIDLWGIGTNLVTSKAQPALGGVYKLGAVYDFDKTLSQDELDALKQAVKQGLQDPQDITAYVRDVIKLSGDAIKVSIPGELDVVRTLRTTADGFRFNGDMIVDALQPTPVINNTLTTDVLTFPKNDHSDPKTVAKGTIAYQPLQRIFEKGNLVGAIETVHDARARATEKMAMLDDTIKELSNPTPYDVRLEQSLYQKRQDKIVQAKITQSTAPRLAQLTL